MKYNIFPYKFIIHICLMFLTMWQVLLQVTPQNTYESEMILTLNTLFMTTDPEEIPEINSISYLYDIPEFRDFVN